MAHITPAVVEFKDLFPHLYERLEREFLGWHVESVQYQYISWKQEHHLKMVLSNGSKHEVVEQYRSPYYAGGFSHVSVREASMFERV